MTSIVPRDIARKLERRWTARIRQNESFHAGTDRLKRDSTTHVEGVRPPDARPAAAVIAGVPGDD